MRIALYGNGSSGNHGCEAIVRGTYTLIKEPLTILSEEMDEDIIYGLAKFCNVLDAKNGKISKARLIRAYMKLKLKNNYTDMDGLPYVDSIKKIKGKVDFAISFDHHFVSIRHVGLTQYTYSYDLKYTLSFSDNFHMHFHYIFHWKLSSDLY